VKIPNAFSPNGDGINDTWIITNLVDYQNNTVEIFNRYGQRVFYSLGYAVPWNGTYNGNPVPTGVYYYIIDLKNGFGKLTGSITVIR
jgi:gliding motility-associated-like protein